MKNPETPVTASVAKYAKKLDLAEVLELHKAKVPVREIARRFKCTRAAVYLALQKAGLNLTEERGHVARKVLSLHEEGLPVKEIAERLQISQHRARRPLTNAGIKPNPRAKRLDTKTQMVITLHQQGHTVPEIAEQVAWSSSAIRNALSRSGLRCNRVSR